MFHPALIWLGCLRRTIPTFLLIFAVVFSTARSATEAASRPVVGPGATREEVLNAYGWPSGRSQSGTKDILTYPQGHITLEEGRVERVDFSPKATWPAPKPRPAPPSPTSAKPAEAPADFWTTSLSAAMSEAERRKIPILALFTGSDWSPPSRQFQSDVALHPDFLNEFVGAFVLLKLDFPTHATQPETLRAQNTALRERYGVSIYPTLLMLAPDGALLARVDLTTAQSGDSFRARVIAAIRETRTQLLAKPPAPSLPSAATEPGKTGRTSWIAAGVLGLVATIGIAAVAGIRWTRHSRPD